jgi:hypothetical protein
MTNSILWMAGGAAIGAGIMMLFGAFASLNLSWDVSLFGSGVTLLSLGLMFWDKAKSRR